MILLLPSSSPAPSIRVSPLLFHVLCERTLDPRLAPVARGAPARWAQAKSLPPMWHTCSSKGICLSICNKKLKLSFSKSCALTYILYSMPYNLHPIPYALHPTP